MRLITLQDKPIDKKEFIMRGSLRNLLLSKVQTSLKMQNAILLLNMPLLSNVLATSK